MGSNKALLPFGGANTLLAFQYHRLKKIFKSLYISCKSPEIFELDANFIVDKSSVFAPTSGFISTFESIEEERFFALSVDTPFVDETVFKSLYMEDKASYDATIARTSKGIHPLCGIYHRSLLDSFKEMQKNHQHKLTLLLKHSHTHFVDFKTQEPFFNLNEPKEYQEACRLLDLQTDTFS